MSLNILLAGESWMKHTIHVKGFDSFTTSEYEEGVYWLREALETEGHNFNFMPGHLVAEQFPHTIEELKQYDVIIISDIGANSFLLSNHTFSESKVGPNRLQLLHDYVEQGGGLLMVGGYLTFQGIDAKARYKGTPIERCLPVDMLVNDDRVELPEGTTPIVEQSNHAILKDIPKEWPPFLGYNRLIAKPDADVLVYANDDPFLSVTSYGKGRSAAFASDCSPHWATPTFLEWEGYGKLWNQTVEWLANKK